MYHSHRANPLLNDTSVFADNVQPVAEVRRVQNRSVELITGQVIQIDAIILCTGYDYNFPFLPAACQPMTPEDRLIQRLSRLYKLTLHVDFPRLLFIGMFKAYPSLLVNSLQAQFAVAALLGKARFPDRAAMLNEIETDFREKLAMGVPAHHIHYLYPMQEFLRRFQDGVAKITEAEWITLIPETYMEFYDHVLPVLYSRPNDFRWRRYPMDTNWKEGQANHAYTSGFLER